jgi:preprotein translocase subunit YajC
MSLERCDGVTRLCSAAGARSGVLELFQRGESIVPNLDLASWVPLAQEQANAPSPIFMFLPLVAIGLLFFFMVLRPQRREQAERQVSLANLKKNDHVLLNCGIFGVVTNVRPDSEEVTIRVDESSNTKLRITRGSIARVIVDDSSPSVESGTTS